MQSAFEPVGFADGYDLAVALATLGLVGGVLIGTALVNWAVRRGVIQAPERFDSLDEVRFTTDETTPEDLAERRRDKVREDQPTDPLSLHLGIVAVAIGLGWGPHVSRRLMNRISGASLDLLIVGAVATVSLQAIGTHLAPFLLLAGAGILWSLSAVLFLAPRVVPTYWFERAAGDFGQSMGVTVTGLLLMRVADPPNRSGALRSR
jgi:glutamate:Na+ symporter, ESS family